MLKILKIAIITMTTLIFLGLGVVFYKIGTGVSSKPTVQSDILYIPANTQTINAFSQGKDLGLLVKQGNVQKILIYKTGENVPSKEILISKDAPPQEPKEEGAQ